MSELQRWFAGVAYDHVKSRMGKETSADVVRGCLRVPKQHVSCWVNVTVLLELADANLKRDQLTGGGFVSFPGPT